MATIITEDKQAQAVAREEVSAVVENARSIVITNRDDLTAATSVLGDIKSQANKLEDKRKQMKAPILEAGRQIDGLWQPLIKELNQAELIVKRTMIDAKRRFDAEDRAKEEKIEARVGEGRGRLKEETAIRQISEIERVDTTVSASDSKASFRKVKVVKVTNANIIPHEYLVPVEGEDWTTFKPWPRIRKVALAQDVAGSPIIPGIQVVEEDSIAAGRL